MDQLYALEQIASEKRFTLFILQKKEKKSIFPQLSKFYVLRKQKN
jgi:hypothetical protein